MANKALILLGFVILLVLSSCYSSYSGEYDSQVSDAEIRRQENASQATQYAGELMADEAYREYRQEQAATAEAEIANSLVDFEEWQEERELVTAEARETIIARGIEESQEIVWSDAREYIGERRWVCGGVVDAYYAPSEDGQPTFLNMGEAYPSKNRFTAVIWGEDRAKFSGPPELTYPDEHICIRGRIYEYGGVPQIEVFEPSEIRYRFEFVP